MGRDQQLINISPKNMDKVANNLHGTAININDYGVLITGISSIGKTELGLNLIDRGHKLVADDAVCIENLDNILTMSADINAVGYMHIRGLGFIHIGQIYNHFDSIMTSSILNLVIELINDDGLFNRGLLNPLVDSIEILGVLVPRFCLPVGINRNLALLSEVVVKYHRDTLNGYDSNQTFIHKYMDNPRY